MAISFHVQMRTEYTPPIIPAFNLFNSGQLLSYL
ncbi:MAG: hypothetical protein JWR69_1286 [Pedosphaera sp.]|nr:hypothetical protein [Pedosphaera sp.]